MEELLKRIKSRKALIGVVGLGYVGLPLVREFTSAGMKVLGFDVDTRKVKALMADCTRLHEKTGWKPEYSYNKGLEMTIDWFSKHLSLFKSGVYTI